MLGGGQLDYIDRELETRQGGSPPTQHDITALYSSAPAFCSSLPVLS